MEITFQYIESVDSGFVAWNLEETDAEKRLIVGEGSTFQELATSVRKALKAYHYSFEDQVPFLVRFKKADQDLQPVAFGIVQSPRVIMKSLTHMVGLGRTSNHGECVRALIPSAHGVIACSPLASKPEVQGLLIDSVKRWAFSSPSTEPMLSDWLMLMRTLSAEEV